MSTPDVRFPITFTDRAAARLARLFEKQGRQGFLRLGVKGGGCSGLEYLLKFDEIEHASDLTSDVGGVPVAVDARSAEFLAGAVLDFTSELIGGGFRFDNPNAKRGCGCGSSFTPRDEPS
jgi:iron-sulfur cluster assembly protein